MKPFRFPGVASFEDSDISSSLFFGRAEESNKLLHYILSEHLTVLFSKSGHGKSSILKASLFRHLREKGYYPFIVRFNRKDFSPNQIILTNIRDISHDKNVEVILQNDSEGLVTLLSGLELWSMDDKLLAPVIVFDQFEEIFTLEHNIRYREALFNELAELLNAIRTNTIKAKIVISIREDFLAYLEKLSVKIPSIFTNRFRLEPLLKSNAEEVIEKPAAMVLPDIEFASPPFYFTERARDTILDFLSLKNVEGDMEETDEIEPIQLQIICSELEERVINNEIPAENGRIIIHSRQMGGQTGMKQILSSFYDKQLMKVRALGLSIAALQAIRNVIEKELIVGKRRVPLDYDALIAKENIDQSAIDLLISNKLLKLESHQGNSLVEISHDTLVEPILGLFEKRRNTEAEAAADKQSKKRIIKIVFYLLSFFIASGIAVIMVFNYQEQQRDKKNADQEKFYFSALAAKKTNLTLAYKIARKGLEIDTSHELLKEMVQQIEENEYAFIINRFKVPEHVVSAYLNERNNKVIINGKNSIYVWDTLNDLQYLYRNSNMANIGDEPVNGNYFMVYAGAGDEEDSDAATIEIMDAPNHVYTRFETSETNANPLVSISGTRFMIGHYLYEKGRQPKHLFNEKVVKDVTAAIISQNGQYIICADHKGTIRIQDVEGRVLKTMQDDDSVNTVKALAVTSDCKYLFSGGTGKDLKVWEAGDIDTVMAETLTALPQVSKGHTDDINDIAVSGDDKYILTGSDDGTAILWRFDKNNKTCDLISVLRGHKAALTFVNFSEDSDEMITGDADGEVIIWRLAKAEELYKKNQLAAFSPLEYRELGLPDGNMIDTYDTGSLKKLIASTIHYSSSLPDVNIYPEDKNYLHRLTTSVNEVITLYSKVFNHKHYIDSVSNLNKAILNLGFSSLMHRKDALLLHRPAKITGKASYGVNKTGYSEASAF